MPRNGLHDQHLHSRHSVDSRADPARNCRQALAEGLSGLTFTEHYDTHPSEWEMCRWDYLAISETVSRLREAFGDRLRVGLGLPPDANGKVNSTSGWPNRLREHLTQSDKGVRSWIRIRTGALKPGGFREDKKAL